MKLQENKIYTIIFTFLITFVFVFILAFVNSVTAEKVDKNFELFKIKAILSAMDIDFTTNDKAYAIFTGQVKAESYQNNEIYFYGDGEDIKYAIIFSGDGLWGVITGVLAVNHDYSRIVGLDFISQQETPGLGGRIAEEWFKKQFRNEIIKNDRIEIISGKGGQGNYIADNKVDAISGATITSDSLGNIINKYLPVIKEAGRHLTK